MAGSGAHQKRRSPRRRQLARPWFGEADMSCPTTGTLAPVQLPDAARSGTPVSLSSAPEPSIWSDSSSPGWSIHRLRRVEVHLNGLHRMPARAVIGDVDFFKNEREAFQMTNARWRSPQLGALGSLLAHWTLTPDEPALVSLPTGAGKTGVALAAPFLTPQPPTRVLVMVPSSALRRQTVGTSPPCASYARSAP